MEFETPKTPEELNSLHVKIHDFAHEKHSTNRNGFLCQSQKQIGLMWEEIDKIKKKVIDKINSDREKDNKAFSFYGPWIACADGSIDYGPNEFYYLSVGWHRDEWILPHVLRKPWRVGTAVDLLRAMRDAGSVTGIKELNVNLEKIY